MSDLNFVMGVVDIENKTIESLFIDVAIISDNYLFLSSDHSCHIYNIACILMYMYLIL